MGCDFWMDAQREAPERLGKANERIRQLEAQVTKLEAQLAEAERKAGALKLASKHVFEFSGSCPYDSFCMGEELNGSKFYGGEFCHKNCNRQYAECWEEYFIFKQEAK